VLALQHFAAAALRFTAAVLRCSTKKDKRSWAAQRCSRTAVCCEIQSKKHFLKKEYRQEKRLTSSLFPCRCSAALQRWSFKP
jgi:hypothetical protein